MDYSAGTNPMQFLQMNKMNRCILFLAALFGAFKAPNREARFPGTLVEIPERRGLKAAKQGFQ